MILNKYDYKGYHAVCSYDRYEVESHIRIYRIGDEHNNVIYHQLIRQKRLGYDDFVKSVKLFVNKKERIDVYRKKIQEIRDETI